MKNIDYSQFKNCTFRINADIEAQVCYVTKNNCMQIKLDKDDILEIKDISYNRGIVKVYITAKSYYLIDKENFDNHIKEFEIDTEIYNESSIKTFTKFINESLKFKKINYLSNVYNYPYANILEGFIDDTTCIAYGIYVKNIENDKIDDEFMEYYTGEVDDDDVPTPEKNSYKRYSVDEIPKKYKEFWLKLKAKYERYYK